MLLTCRAEEFDRLPPGLVRLADARDGRIDLGPLDVAAVAELAERRYGIAEALQTGATLNEEDGHFMHGMVAEFEVA